MNNIPENAYAFNLRKAAKDNASKGNHGNCGLQNAQALTIAHEIDAMESIIFNLRKQIAEINNKNIKKESQFRVYHEMTGGKNNFGVSAFTEQEAKIKAAKEESERLNIKISPLDIGIYSVTPEPDRITHSNQIEPSNMYKYKDTEQLSSREYFIGQLLTNPSVVTNPFHCNENMDQTAKKIVQFADIIVGEMDR